MFWYHVAKQIKELRLGKEISVEEMCEQTGFTPVQYDIMEQGKFVFSVDTINKIAAVLDVNPLQLIQVEESEEDDHLLVNHFRKAGYNEETLQEINKLEDMMKAFTAQERLALQMKHFK